MINNGRWYGMYTPGFPVLLLIGLLFKTPWLVNPAFAFMTVVLLFFLGKEIYDKSLGVLAAVLGSVSIWFLLLSATMMAHTTSMFFNALFLLCFFKSTRDPKPIYSLTASLSLGMAFLIRPGSAAFFALPYLIYIAFLAIKDFRLRGKATALFAMGGAFFLGLLLLYNQLTNGNPFKMGYIVHHGESYAVIFGRPATLDYDFTPLRAIDQIWMNIRAINSDLFGWPIPAFLALVPLLWAARTRPREVKKDLALICGLLSIVVGFTFFWGAYVYLGARMLFDAFPILILLSAKGIRESIPLFAVLFKTSSLASVRRTAAIVLIGFSLYGFFIRFPRWAWPSDTEYYYMRYDSNMAGSSTALHKGVKALGLHHAVIILKYIYTPLRGIPTGWWSSGFAENTPSLDGDIIYAVDAGEKNAELFKSFPDRRFYLFVGTLGKGVLAPIESSENRAGLPGELLSLPPEKGRIEFVQDPCDLYRPYSDRFKGFLKKIYAENHFSVIDVPWLQSLGINLKERGEYGEAALAFEAALQIENAPNPRWALLSLLTSCYQKTHQVHEAMAIMRKIDQVGYEPYKLFSIIPERGF
jgi:hypothetical protein